MNSYTTADLLTAVQTIGMLPQASTGSLSNDNLLIHATDELHGTLVPMILAVREHYYETSYTFTITANQNTYTIPIRAIGGVLSSVQYVYNTNMIPLMPIPPASATTTWASLSPRGYWFQNNSITIYPTPSAQNYQIILRYFQRPSRLTQLAYCAQITAINTIANTVTVTAAPSSWTTGTVVDFVPLLYPNTPYGLDQPITGVTGQVISFAALPSGVSVGDWLTPDGYTPLPEMPFEMFPALAQATVCKALESLGDMQGLQLAQQNFQTKVENALKLITPRDQTGPKRVTSGWRSL